MYADETRNAGACDFRGIGRQEYSVKRLQIEDVGHLGRIGHVVCMDARREAASKPPALRQILHLLEHQRRLIPRAGILMPAPHFSQGGIALCRRGVPMKSVPLGTEELAERVA